MKKIIYTLLLVVTGSLCMFSQTVEIISPAGLTPPYEVSPGTEITFKWDYFFEAPTAFFTHTEEPVFPGFGTDPFWVEHTGFVDNGDGTFNITIVFNEPLWVWGGFFSPFISQWNFSEVFEINIASNVVIEGDDLLLCNDGIDTEQLMVTDTFDGYQWYMNGVAIPDADSAIYLATDIGSYSVSAIYNSETTNSNTLNISFIEILLTGAYIAGSPEVLLSATSGMDTYQWLSGPDETNLTQITGETIDVYNASITTDLTYYAAQATLAGCTVETDARAIADSFFTASDITVSADTNSFNAVCEGVQVTLMVGEGYASYKWLRDGNDAYNNTNTLTVSQGYQEGEYSVEVTNNEWPEIQLLSPSVSVNFLDVIQPQLIGVINYGDYCPGDNIDILLGDEGYNYTWYQHSEYNYSEEDTISVSGSTYSFVFDTAVYITVVGEFQGCMAERTVFLDSYENTSMYIRTENWDQTYLCDDSTNVIYLPSWDVDKFQDFQWFILVDSIYEPIQGADTTFLEIDEPGSFKLQAVVKDCPNVTIFSNEQVINHYSEREIYIYAVDESICVGDTSVIYVSGGANWENIQWFEEDVIIGSSGYEKTYIPIVGAGSESNLAVTELQTYLVKAKHYSCPNGLKNTSNIVGIKPLLNPTITPDPSYGIYSWHVGPFDSIPNYVYCDNQPIVLSLSESYESIQWHSLPYTGDDDYDLGPAIPGATSDSIEVNAAVDFYTAVVMDSTGCVGYSDPVLIDTWAFLSPVIASYNNSELCYEGDSTLLHLGFPADWDRFEWYKDGILVPDSNSDTLWAKEPGTYTLTAYPSLCPDFGYSSGAGPTVKYLFSEILENDSLIYAIPFQGFYTYQWYHNGDSIPSSSPPWVLHKDTLEDGDYTVAVSNENCTIISEPYTWISNSVSDIDYKDIMVYPNPTNDIVFLEGINSNLVEEIHVLNSIGMKVKTLESIQTKSSIDLSKEKPGIYLLELSMKNGKKYHWKIHKF